MLKKRIIATIPVIGNTAVQSIGFKKYLPLGKPDIAIEFLNQWGVDEIVVLQIDARKHEHQISAKQIQQLASKCFVPLTYGGGVKTIDDVHLIIHNGADKVSLNQPVLHQPEFITEIAYQYGNQCIVASIDIIKIDNSWKVFDYVTQKVHPIDFIPLIQQTINAGAGELLINAVHKDGKYTGYDIELMQKISELATIPVLAAGGAKHPEHMLELLKNTKVSAAVAGNYFHFYEHSVTIAKKHLSNTLNEIRTETSFNYHLNQLDNDGRLLKKSDEILEHLLYTKIEKEII
ncbi:MAG: HisA/HisF-related TIM barrel protein [Bacteroidia bacterium]|jgi:cyclase|nr:HisA/HisF-related TIM barrel protein [Bacteroidia bacterium]